jgi:uncharacterized membrane protein (UPF0127 family)
MGRPTVRARRATGEVVADRVEVATSLWARGRGLLARARLEPGAGLLIDPCNSIHTFFMRFAIDAVFLDRENRVVRILHNLRPWRLSWVFFRARRVLELPAGAARAAGLEPGERLSLS